VSDASADSLASVVAEARAVVAAGGTPDVAALTARIQSLGAGAAGERRALQQLDRVVAVARARARLAREATPPSPPPPMARPSRLALQTKPTITGNLDLRRGAAPFTLVWDARHGVVHWEVRLSERPDARSEYREVEVRELAAAETSVELPLGDNPFRVNVLGRGRDGRLLSRALLSGLTRATWGDRWQRRATAS
jgi:hypothetical protein